MSQSRVADHIISFLEKAGAKHVFLVSGGGIMHLTDALKCNGGVQAVCCHHEQAAAMAANGYARAKEGVGAAIVTTGPGSTNAVTGVAEAWIDSVPLIIVSGQANREQNVHNSPEPKPRQIGTQEINIIPIVSSITKYAEMVNEPERVLYHMEKALFLSKSGRPGPVWIDVPLDVQGTMVEESELEHFSEGEIGVGIGGEDSGDSLDGKLSESISMLKGAKRPLIVAGHGVRTCGCVDKFLKVVEGTRIPVALTRLGSDILPHDHPQYVGKIGGGGDRAGNFAVQNADLLLVLGSRLSLNSIGYEYRLFSEGSKKIYVDIDKAELEKGTLEIDLPINCDLAEFLTKLGENLGGIRAGNAWEGKCRSWKEKYPVFMEEYAREEGHANYYYLMEEMGKISGSGDVFITDAGISHTIVPQSLKLKKGQMLIMSSGLGSMGYGLPAAIGAYYSGKKTIALVGDGSLQMNIQEFQTIKHNGVGIKLFVINNDGYVSIRNTQKNFFGRFMGEGRDSGVSTPDLSKIAGAYGIDYESIRDNSEVGKLGKVLGHDGPIICEVFCSPQQSISPRMKSERLPNGKLVSKPLDDMYPFLDRETYGKEKEIATQE
jgi:acetolactate synthase-1/2/3 large subunit